MLRVTFLVLLLLSLVFAQSSKTTANDRTYSAEDEPEEQPPAVVLGSFQGSYTSTGAYLQQLNLCVDDDNNVVGSYDQVGVIQGTVKTSKSKTTLTGKFYEAGTYPCTVGSFSIELTTDGFNGTYTCDENGKQYLWSETRLSSVRPTDEECAILDTSDATLAGQWQDKSGHPLFLCFSGNSVTGSYAREPVPSFYGNSLVQGYVEAKQYLGGKIVTGTWYENFTGGAIMYIYRNDERVEVWKWTGLAGADGQTAIDPTEYFDESLHTVTHYDYFFGDAKKSNCTSNSGLKTFVLNNLNDDDEDYYYFVGSDWFNSEFVPAYELTGARPISNGKSDSSAAVVVANLALFVLCLVGLLF